MPHLRRPNLNVFLGALLLLHFGRLESNLCADTEVSDNVQDDLLQHGVFRELLEHVRLRVELI